MSDVCVSLNDSINIADSSGVQAEDLSSLNLL